MIKSEMRSINLDQPPQHNSGVTKQNDITLEVARPTQLGILMPLVTAYHLFEKISLSADIREKSVEKLLSNGTLGEIWLIKKFDKLIGYAVICFSFSIELGGRAAFIDELYIEAPARGKGIGTEILRRLKEHMRSHDVVAILLEVDQLNEPAKSLYVQLGFSCRDKYQLMAIALK